LYDERQRRGELSDKRLAQFGTAVKFYKSRFALKLFKAPATFFCSVLAEIILKASGTSLRVKTQLFGDDEMTVVLPEGESLALYRYGFFEEGLTMMLLKYLKPGMTFLDVGAHFGYYTLLGTSIVGENGQVHSFEPTPSSFQMLRHNTRGKRNVHLSRVALFSKQGVMTFNDYGARFSGFNSLYRARLKGDRLQRITPARYDVRVMPLDDYVREQGISPDFVKIDAESAEYEILQGMQRTVKELRPIVTLEVGDLNVPGALKSKNVISSLTKQGYQAYDYREGRISRHTLKKRYDYDNILFLPA